MYLQKTRLFLKDKGIKYTYQDTDDGCIISGTRGNKGFLIMSHKYYGSEYPNIMFCQYGKEKITTRVQEDVISLFRKELRKERQHGKKH